ncbi:MAG: 2-succinyl-5-enolpyruvyl-6-hydroxy-3-cyclohexene-1-carboxylic-acid synthase [Marinifilaceae bacterium]|jgi:2-succinyl-5-enolpyruvyl-6-hydroxy-3-cyclohexene-1-carboxylate synthase|nr:2-succinyl-5-enolpyruvyl-6-hydroxy-3-cyclohexene-1-carboxylic-acid synthase [Marinifilaceae bacterium]
MKYIGSSIEAVQHIIELCLSYGVKKVVISPGSRNAPLIIGFANHPEIEDYVIVDERSAAYFALGLSQQSYQPVALICTSGSALLNYGPALSEAYYQKLPLIVLSADRPREMIDIDDSQTIRQENLFDNIVKHSCALPVMIAENQVEYKRKISFALSKSVSSPMGPVHINIPLKEPLYGKKEQDIGHQLNHIIENDTILTEQSLEYISNTINESNKIMIIMAMLPKNHNLEKLIKEISVSNKVIILSESVSRIYSDSYIANIDRVLASISESEESDFMPDLLISVGGPLISKKIKQFVRRNNLNTHFYVGEENRFVDTYQNLTKHIDINPYQFFEQLKDVFVQKSNSIFKNNWLRKAKISSCLHNKFTKSVPWSDFKVYDSIVKSVPPNYHIQVSNSSVIRYIQLFDWNRMINNYSNRGVSGIDGSSSTAIGAANATKLPSLLITGDISFMYDSNAYWNKYLPQNFKIIVVNNSGGSIFGFISDDLSKHELEEYFVAKHNMSVQNIAARYGISYVQVNSSDDIDSKLEEFFAVNDKPILLELLTDYEESNDVLKEYFKYIKTNYDD